MTSMVNHFQWLQYKVACTYGVGDGRSADFGDDAV